MRLAEEAERACVCTSTGKVQEADALRSLLQADVIWL